MFAKDPSIHTTGHHTFGPANAVTHRTGLIVLICVVVLIGPSRLPSVAPCGRVVLREAMGLPRQL